MGAGRLPVITASDPEVTVCTEQGVLELHQTFECNGVYAFLHLTYFPGGNYVAGHVTYGRHVTEL